MRRILRGVCVCLCWKFRISLKENLIDSFLSHKKRCSHHTQAFFFFKLKTSWLNWHVSYNNDNTHWHVSGVQ